MASDTRTWRSPSIGDGQQVQRYTKSGQPGGDLGCLRQHVGAGMLQIRFGRARHRRDQLAVADRHALRDLLPGGTAHPIDGDDVGAPVGQPVQRPGLAARTEQHQVAVRQVEPFRVNARQVQRLRVGGFDEARRGPGIDAPRQRVAAQVPALVGHFPARRRVGAAAAQVACGCAACNSTSRRTCFG